jgi:hypothetical protein
VYSRARSAGAAPGATPGSSSEDAAYTRRPLLGRYAARPPEHLRPRLEWFSRPDLLVDRRGEGVDKLIDRIEAAVKSYPVTMNTDVARRTATPSSPTSGSNVPELRLDLPSTRSARTTYRSRRQPARAGAPGVQFSLYGLLGVIVAPEEGLEFNVLGLSLGVDVAQPALRLPGLGRVGTDQSPH